MKEGKASETKSGNKGLVILLCVLAVVIVGLGVGISVIMGVQRNIKSDENSERINKLIDTEEAMSGWDGEVSDSTKAMILTDDIRDKLQNNVDYDVSDAIAEYDEVYRGSDGDLKVYVAIEYANYLYTISQDVEASVKILEDVDDLTNNDFLRYEYLSALYYIYQQAGDVEKSDYYKGMILEKYPPDEGIVMKGAQ